MQNLFTGTEPKQEAAYMLGRSLGTSAKYLDLMTANDDGLYMVADPAIKEFAEDMALFAAFRKQNNATKPLLFALPQIHGAAGWVNLETLIAAWPAVREAYLKRQKPHNL